MKKNILLYRFNFFNGQFNVWALRLVCLVAIGFVGVHYEENPIVISVVIAFFVIGFCVVSYEDVFVFEDKFEHRHFWMFGRKSIIKSYRFSDIRTVECRGMGNLGTAAVAFILSAALKARSNRRYTTLIDIEMNDGKWEEINVSLDRSTSESAVEAIQKTML